MRRQGRELRQPTVRGRLQVLAGQQVRELVQGPLRAMAQAPPWLQALAWPQPRVPALGLRQGALLRRRLGPAQRLLPGGRT